MVCTANLCRSPMAEVLLRRALPEASVRSMGTRAVAAQAAHPHARASVQRLLETDLSSHRSSPLLPTALRQADFVLVMENEHRDDVLRGAPMLAGRVRLLGHWRGLEIEDPIGRGEAAFDACLLAMQQCVTDWVPRLRAIAS